MSQKKALKEDPTELAVAYILTRKNVDIRNLNAEGLAAAIQADLGHLAPVFEREQKISIPGFIVREKIYRAYFLLRKRFDITVPELSKGLGFSSLALFEKSFEKYICIKPGKFKEFVKQRKTGEPAKTKPVNIDNQL